MSEKSDQSKKFTDTKRKQEHSVTIFSEEFHHHV